MLHDQKSTFVLKICGNIYCNEFTRKAAYYDENKHNIYLVNKTV